MTLRKGIVAGSSALLLLAFSGAATFAQSSTPAQKPPTTTPLKVDVVIARFQGDKKVASLPFAMWLTTKGDGRGYQSTRVGVDVPVSTATVTTGRSNPTGQTGASTTTSEQTAKTEYRFVGTQIDCTASTGNLPSDEGKFWINVQVSDSSIYTGDNDPKAVLKVSDPMAFRTFTMTNQMLMRDGQTLQFATATDKVTGETIRVDVTLTAIK